MSERAIERAVKLAGGQTALAAAIGVSQGLVWQWIEGKTFIHQRHYPKIEKAVKGEVTAQELFADELKRTRTA